MKRTEREQLIERYLEGSLTPVEEQEFFIEVATDREMQYDLKASQVVESAIRKDRELAPNSWSGTRAELTAMLTAAGEVGVKEKVGRGSSSHAHWGAGWIVAAVVLLLVSFTALLVSLVAIDRTTTEQVRTTPLLTPQSEQVIQREANLPEQPEAVEVEKEPRSLKSVEKAKNEEEKQRSPQLHHKTGVEEQTDQNPLHSLKTNEPITTDTTNPNSGVSVELETPN
ncbi:MAG: hypothetical protein KDD67_04450 [Ignavibacteriae bacterium]|nr:hypothetical protein [Ignavibacteriota bacterium]MCB9214859.1 hypothetical protein [Ignavibacteria bacterium]